MNFNSIGFSIDDSNKNIASGTGRCWVNKYYYSPLNFSPLFGSRFQREGFIFVCPMTDPASVCVSINKSQKQLTVKGKSLQNKYLFCSNFPYSGLDFCIDADTTKRFDRNSISYKFDNGILTVEFVQVEDNQFELVKNQPIFNNKPVDRPVQTRRDACDFGCPSAYYDFTPNFLKKVELPFLNLVEIDKEYHPTKSFSTPNLRTLNLPPIPSEFLEKNENSIELPEEKGDLSEGKGDITPIEEKHNQTPQESSNDSFRETEDGITLIKNNGWQYNNNINNTQTDNLCNETPIVEDE